jgi:hypothetical protein
MVKIGMRNPFSLSLQCPRKLLERLADWSLVDFSHNEAVQTIESMYGPNAAQVLQNRWQIIKSVYPLSTFLA